MTPKSDIILFPGTFNPFTVGHKSIADRCLQMGARVVIGIGYNIEKKESDIEKRIKAIEEIFAGCDRVEVKGYSGLTAEFAREIGATFMVRGVRSVADFEYERNLADANYDISGVETLLMPALPQYSFISSSMVRELQANGHDVSKYLPCITEYTKI